MSITQSEIKIIFDGELKKIGGSHFLHIPADVIMKWDLSEGDVFNCEVHSIKRGKRC